MDISKFTKWLRGAGCEILPVTNEYEEVRFKGKKTGILYKSGKVSNNYTQHAVNCFTFKKYWNGGPIKTGRGKYNKKHKKILIERDGTKCFMCGQEMGDDITLEHLVPLCSGGKNSLSNMVLMHEKCNRSLGNMPIHQKISKIIKSRKEHESPN